jgi:hypothetical protein
VYCGKPIKESDKFCIHCGKPRLTNLPKADSKPQEKIPEPPKEEKSQEIEKSTKEDLKEVPKEEIIQEEKEEDEKAEKEKEEDKKSKEIQPLPDDVKRQIDLYLEMNSIELKKKNLDEKLVDLQKDLKSSRYETDFEFGEQINIQLEAVKTVLEELKQKENEIKQEMDEKFIIEQLNFDIDTKKSQLKNLVREHKLRKIKDKEVVNKLKEKYKGQLDDYIEEKADLIAGIKLWIEEMKEEKTELITERKFNKARFSSKEVSEEEFKIKDEEYNTKIEKINSKINTLEDLT